MANLNQGADPVALPIVPCPDCGRNVLTYVARRGQNACERSTRAAITIHQVVDATSISSRKPTPTTSPRLVQQHPHWHKSSQLRSKSAKRWELKVCSSRTHRMGSRTGREGTQFASSGSAAAGYMVAAPPVAGRQPNIAFYSLSSNLYSRISPYM